MERDSQFSVYTLEGGTYYIIYGHSAMWMLPNNDNDHEWAQTSKGTMSRQIYIQNIERLAPLEIEGTFDECYDALRLYLLVNS